MSIKERLAKLINVKSIVTLALTIVFCILAATGAISSTAFLSIFTTVISFYFGTQAAKSNKQDLDK